MKVKDTDIHHHLEARMLQRGISKEEIEITINKGWIDEDAKEGTPSYSLIITIGKINFMMRKRLPFIIR